MICMVKPVAVTLILQNVLDKHSAKNFALAFLGYIGICCTWAA